MRLLGMEGKRKDRSSYVRDGINAALGSGDQHARLLEKRPGWGSLPDMEVVVFDAHRGKKLDDPLLLQYMYDAADGDKATPFLLDEAKVADLEQGKSDDEPMRANIVRVYLRTSAA